MLLQRGDSVSVWLRSDGEPTARAYFGFGASEAGTLSIVMAPNSGTLILQRNVNFGFQDLASVPQNWLPDHWYRLEVSWHFDGSLVGRLYDSDGVTLLNQIEGYDEQFVAGGIAFRAFGSTKHFDTVQRGCRKATSTASSCRRAKRLPL